MIIRMFGVTLVTLAPLFPTVVMTYSIDEGTESFLYLLFRDHWSPRVLDSDPRTNILWL